MKLSGKIIILLLFLGFIISYSTTSSYAEDPTPTPTKTPTPTGPTPTPDRSGEISDISKRIADLQSKLQSTQSEERTLSSQIKTMDTNIQLTQYRITATQNELTAIQKDINTTTTKISSLESALSNITKVLLSRVVATYQAGMMPDIKLFVSANDFSNYVSRESYLKIVQQHDKKLIYDTQQAKNDYQNQKKLFEDKKVRVEQLNTQLQTYKTQLDQEKTNKERLLKETQGNEATYQRLIAQAQAQLAGFSNFTASQGGASLLSNQTVCDDWGCYYNQRDSQWGAMPLNGTKYTLASDGCLITSMAMVYTHYGRKGVTPLTINSNPNNFASYYPAWLLKTIVADGVTTTRVTTSIDSELSQGRPVIVGISYDSGPLADHFLVLISGSNGNYHMNDPFTPNGHNIPFTSKYTVASIREIEKVVGF